MLWALIVYGRYDINHGIFVHGIKYYFLATVFGELEHGHHDTGKARSELIEKNSILHLRCRTMTGWRA